jgi:energy-converting hydrogenase Eha subunit B
MFNVELFESVLAVVGVVMLRFVLFLAVVFVMAIPIGIVVKTAEAIGRHVRRVPAVQAAGSGTAAAKVPR